MNYSCLSHFFWHDLINICFNNNNFAQQINTPNVSGNGHSVILACNKSINYVMVLILKIQRPFLTTWYTFGNGGTLFATKLYRVVQFWLRKSYLVVPFISARKKRRGPNFSYLVRGDQLLHDKSKHLCSRAICLKLTVFLYSLCIKQALAPGSLPLKLPYF